MDLEFSPEDIAFRKEARAFIAENYPAALRGKQDEGEELAKEDYLSWHRVLAKQGWVAPAWPKEYGGPGWTTTQRFIWSEEQIDHIARHGVSPDEFEESCSGKCMTDRAKSKGQNPVYLAYGQTETGRYLTCVVIRFPDGNGYPVTARDMTPREKKRYRKWRDR